MFETVKLIRKVSNLEDHLIGHPLRINQSLHMYHHIKNHIKACVSHSSLKLNPSKIHLFIHSHSNNTKLRQLFPYVLRNLKTKEIMKIWVKTIVETENALKKVFLLTNQNLQVFIFNFFNITRIESISEVRHCDFIMRITHQNKANWM